MFKSIFKLIAFTAVVFASDIKMKTMNESTDMEDKKNRREK